MFFLLEDERETGYSEVHNKRKLELLNQDTEKRDFFLSSLQQTTNNLLPISREDTLFEFAGRLDECEIMMAKHLVIDLEKLYSYNIENYFKVLSSLLSQPSKDNTENSSNQAIS